VGAATANALLITPGATASAIITLTPSGTGAVQIGGGANVMGNLTVQGPNGLIVGTAAGNPLMITAGATAANQIVITDIGGGIQFSNIKTGFNASVPIAKPTVTGSRGGNAAVLSMLAALSAYGLITDSTTA
jgi:hypothetical protein